MKQHVPKIYRLATAGFVGGLLIGSFGTVIGASLGSDVFVDVQEDTFYDEAVGELYGDGIIKGYDSRHFGPDDFVTRGQLAVMLKRLRDDMEKDFTSSSRSSSSHSSDSSSSSSGGSSSRNPKGTFRFTTATFTVNETADRANITLVRTGGNTGEVEVEYSVTGQSASSGSDFTQPSGEVTFEDGQTSKTISIDIVDDSSSESNETFTVKIISVSNRASIGSPDTATVTIADNESSSNSNSSSSSRSSSSSSNPSGTLSMAAAGYTVDEAGGTLTVTVIREGGSSGTVGISYSTTNGTATSGSDYSNTNGTLSFGSNETSKSFTIPIHDDAAIDGNKNFTVKLASVTGGASLGTATATVTVFDDEGAAFGSGTLKLSKSSYTVLESSGSAELFVQRVGGADGSITVEYATVSATAYAGADFTAVSGTLTFAVNESSKIIRIPLVKDTESELDDYFRFHLSNPSSSTSLMEPYQAVVTIDN